MTWPAPRPWKVVIHRWEEYELLIEARTRDEAEDRALETYSDHKCVDDGIDWIEVEVEDP